VLILDFPDLALRSLDGTPLFDGEVSALEYTERDFPLVASSRLFDLTSGDMIEPACCFEPTYESREAILLSIGELRDSTLLQYVPLIRLWPRNPLWMKVVRSCA